MLDLSRSSLYTRDAETKAKPDPDVELAERIHQLILQHPTFGYRRIWALLRYRAGERVNRKRVYQLMKRKNWMLHQRLVTPRLRVQKLRSRAEASNQRWAMEII